MQAVKALVGEVIVRPPLMIRAAAPTVTTRPLTQYAAQTHANPTVEVREHGPVTMPKVSKPTVQRSIQMHHNPLHAVPVGAACLRSDGVLQLVQAFLTRQAELATEGITQKVKAIRPRLQDLRLGSVE